MGWVGIQMGLYKSQPISKVRTGDKVRLYLKMFIMSRKI